MSSESLRILGDETHEHDLGINRLTGGGKGEQPASAAPRVPRITAPPLAEQ